MSGREAIAEALDDLVMSKGIALDEVRLDWLTEFVSGLVAEARFNAWNEGWNAAVDSNGFPGDVNPYRAADPRRGRRE